MASWSWESGGSTGTATGGSKGWSWEQTKPAAPKPSSGGGSSGGLLGLVENLGSDVYHTVTDIPSGLARLGSQVAYDSRHYPVSLNPITDYHRAVAAWNDPHSLFGGGIAPAVRSEKHIYGSALHGNFHPLYEHPLTPILDIATIASGGGAGALRAARLGAFGERAAQFARADRTLTSGGLTETLNSSRTLQGRLRQARYDKFSQTHPDLPLVGANPRLARISTIRAGRNMMRSLIPVGEFRRIVAPLSRDEQRALHIAAEGVPLDERISFYRNLPQQTKLTRAYVKAIDRPGVRAAIENPSERMVAAVNAARDLEAKAGQRLIDTGQLTPEIRAERALLPQRIMQGGSGDFTRAVLEPTEAERAAGITAGFHGQAAPGFSYQEAAQADGSILANIHPDSLGAASRGVLVRLRGNTAEIEVSSLPAEMRGQGLGSGMYRAAAEWAKQRGARVFQADRAEVSTEAQRVWQSMSEHPPPGWIAGPDRTLVRSAENGANPVFGAPFRFPHASAETQPGLFTSPKQAPAGKVKPLGQLKKNAGARARAAAFGTMPEQYISDYLQTQRHEELLRMQHDVMGKVGQPLDEALPGGKNPTEHYYRPSHNRSTTQPIPRPVREEQALMQDLTTPNERETGLAHTAQESVFTAKNAPADVREALHAGDIKRLNELGVKRVPAAFGKRYAANFAGTSPVTRFFFDRPLDVWRAVTLNARPAWMVNNLVGNNLMYFLRHPSGAGSYLRALARTERGDDKIRQLWRWTVKHPTIRRKYERVFQQVAPEIHESGLYATQTRQVNAGVYQQHLDNSAAFQAAKKLALPAKAIVSPIRAVGHGITFLERHIAENAPREAAMMRELEPLTRKLRAAGMSWEDALKSLDRRQVELAVDRTLDFLGDFNAMTPFERRYVRRVIPFWSWYRVIVKVSGKYAADYPARVNLLHQMALQAQGEDKNLPSWLRGEIQLGPVKGGVQPVLSTTGLNPYQTLTQLATENPIALTNPFIQAAGVGAFNTDPFLGGAYRGWGASKGATLPDVLRRFLGSVAYESVPGRLGQQLTGPTHSTLYQPKTYGHVGPVPINDYLLQYLGLPLRHVKVAQAKAERNR